MHEKAINIIRRLIKHDYIELTSRGNTAVFAALYCARKLRLKKKTALIPDQGGWLTYKKYPKMLELNIVELKTNLGIIDIEELKKALIKHDVNCLIYENPAGYFAEQPIKEIYEACRGRCTVIMDASGCIGNKEQCSGDFADIMVGSFGKWKPVNVGYGGFISFREERNYLRAKEIFNTTAFDDEYLPLLIEKLNQVNERMLHLEMTSKKIKQDLLGYNIAHEKKRGINVVVLYSSEEEKQSIISYCEKNKYEYTQCPRYIRVMSNAISIEVKRL